ncbi:MAG: hypothetical protein OJF61_002951 [Rhodanobacteraceae bacterium]|jgi:hypothetical protein|nr:MAG: hypothetical protein OJF61_002951 [Rhodanobacteraceae bacterium]
MTNPIHDYLDSIDLPWRMNRASLVEKYGITAHVAYEWNVIELNTLHPFVNGLLWPISVQAFDNFSPFVPATEFSGHSYFKADARENLYQTTNQLIPVLGDGETTGASNCIGRKWTFGSATVELFAWPAELQQWPMTNHAHEREPKLKTACAIAIKTGFRFLISPKDRELLESFEPIVKIPVGRKPWNDPSAPQYALEFIRLPEESFNNLIGGIGYSRERSALIFFTTELYMVTMDDVIQFQLTRMLPAKGLGRSRLDVVCRCDYQAQKTKVLEICAADGPDDLNALAIDIADAVDKPLSVLPYCYDT